jgi:imidazolonepropionase-like amidohydrolase
MGLHWLGFGDHHEAELPVSDAGFIAVEAIMIATLNGATHLWRQSRIGSVETRKNADKLIVRGDPFTCITDIEYVEIVIKRGTA